MIYQTDYEYDYDCGTTATTTLGSTWGIYKNSTSATTINYPIKIRYKDNGTYPVKIKPYGIYNKYGTSTTELWVSSKAATTSATIEWDLYGKYGYEYEYEYGDCSWQSVPMSAEEKEKQLKKRFSEIVQGRCSPNIIVRQNSKRNPLPMPADIREQRARETLRRVIGDQKYIGFIKHGFISVKGRSGLVYQIFTGSGITHVFDQGNLVDRLCVVLQGDFPPTDSLIMRYLLILNNEQQFRSLAIKHSISGYESSHPNHGHAEMKPLAEIFKELKLKIA